MFFIANSNRARPYGLALLLRLSKNSSCMQERSYFRNRQRSRRIDMYEIIVLERSGTFQHYFVQGFLQ